MTKILLTFAILFSFQAKSQEVDYIDLLSRAFQNQNVSPKCPDWKVLNLYDRPGKNKFGVRIQLKLNDKQSKEISVFRLREIFDGKESGLSFSTVAREDLVLGKLGQNLLKAKQIDELTLKRLYELITDAPVYFFEVDIQGSSLYVKNIGQVLGDEKTDFCR